VLGVTIPLCEAVGANLTIGSNVGILATRATCLSGSFEKELKKLNPDVNVFCHPAPLLVPIIEEGEMESEGADIFLKQYLRPLLGKDISSLVLGCTHYSLLFNKISRIIGDKISVVSADRILPPKLKDYLFRHPEIESKIFRNSKKTFLTTDLSSYFKRTVRDLFGKEICIEKVSLE